MVVSVVTPLVGKRAVRLTFLYLNDAIIWECIVTIDIHVESVMYHKKCLLASITWACHAIHQGYSMRYNDLFLGTLNFGTLNQVPSQLT